MRNLKKMLSLVMALAMVASFMVVGASAAKFSDDKDIVNTEAVSMLVELGVIKGRDTGSFDPTGIVTRAEMAKMICVVLNGGNEPQLGNISSSFTDVKGTANAWADPYIAFCAQQGIIAGYEDGTFKPGNTVTGTEAAKMLLVAMGYNAEIAGFTGGSWDVNINVSANKNNLYKSMTINPAMGLTRDGAALMIFNALSAKTVNYEYTLAPVNGVLTSIPKLVESNKTLLEDAFKAIKVVGTVIANEYANLGSTSKNDDGVVVGSALDAGKTNIVVNNYDDQATYKDVVNTFSVATGAEALGREVTLYVKPASTSVKATILGNAIVNEDNKIVTDYTSDKIVDVADDNNVDLTGNTIYAYNYNGTIKTLSDAEGRVAAGVEKILVDSDNDGKVDYVLLNTYAFGKVTAYSTKDDGSITVKSGTTTFTADKSKNVIGFEDVAKNDYVMAQYIGGKLYVNAAETVTGTLEAYKGTDSLTVDGTKYNVSKVEAYSSTADGVYVANGYGASTTLDVDATFYLDNYGYAIAAGDVAETAYNYAYVMSSVNSGNTLDLDRVKVTLQDGTTKTYNVASKNSLQVNTTNSTTWANAKTEIIVGGIYAYTITSDGEIKLTAPTGTADLKNLTANVVFSKGKTTVTGANGSTYASANTVFFYDNGTDVSVYTGYSKAPSVAAGDTATGTYAVNKGGKTVAIAFQAGSFTSADVGNHMFLYKTGSTHTDYVEGTAYLNGSEEPTEITINTADSVSTAADSLYTYTVNNKGEYVLSNVPGANVINPDAVATHVSASTVIIGGNEYKVTDKTVLVDNSGNPSKPNASLNGMPASDDIIASILFNTDKEALMIIIDNGEGGGAGPVIPTGAFDGNNRVNLSDPDAVTFDFYKTLTKNAAVALIKAADSNIVNVDARSLTGSGAGLTGTIDVTYANGDLATLQVGTVTEYFTLTAGSDVTIVYTVAGDDFTVNPGNTAYVADSTAVTYETTDADAVIEVAAKADVKSNAAKTGTQGNAVAGTAVGADVWVYAASKVGMTDVTEKNSVAADNDYVKVGTKLNLVSDDNTADLKIKSDIAGFVGTMADGTKYATHTYTVGNADVAFTVEDSTP